MPKTTQTEIEALSFEEAMIQLEQLVRQLEGGQSKLDDAINAYERGALLKRHCEKKLREAESRVEKIAVTESGEIRTEPLNL